MRHQTRLPRRACSRSIASNSDLKLPSPNPSRAVPLDDFEEQRRPILDRLREDLQQIPFVVAVGHDAELGELLDRLVDLADALLQVLVIRAAARAGTPRRRARSVDTVSTMSSVAQRDVLHARAAVVIEVFLDLRLALARWPAR